MAGNEPPVSDRALVRTLLRGSGPGAKSAPSPFRAMWLIVLFDLPVGSAKERRHATRFRNMLLDEGFMMKQFSVYQRYFENRGKAEAAADRIGAKTPPMGNVSTVFLTDKQVGMIRNYSGGAPAEDDEKPDQLALF